MSDWQQTMNLRFVVRNIPFDPINKVRILQQQWVRQFWISDQSGDPARLVHEAFEWRDVPVEDE